MYHYSVKNKEVCCGSISFEIKNNKIQKLLIKGRYLKDELVQNPQVKEIYESYSKLLGSDVEKLIDAKFRIGCVGNMMGWRRILVGLDIDTVIERLSGTKCRGKSSSCPDTIAKALTQYKHDSCEG